MSLKRESVLGVLILCMVLMGTASIQAQGKGKASVKKQPAATKSIQTKGSATAAAKKPAPAVVETEDSATSVKVQIATLQLKLDQALAEIAQLKTAMQGIGGGGVSQATLDAAIAAEAAARAGGDAALQGSIDEEEAARTTAMAALQVDVDALEPLVPLASYVSIETGTVNDLQGPHVIFTGANVHIRSGHSWGDSLAQNGKGNLILGYNESGGYDPAERNGSHNVVVGPFHRYNFGVGLVVGYNSRLGGDGASVSGGLSNNAGGEFSSVTGGSNNQATALAASVSGGDSNFASGANASVSAGQMNQASGDLSSVSGGNSNAATAILSTVGGGSNQTNSVGFTFVP
jgi:hypothetical protein